MYQLLFVNKYKFYLHLHVIPLASVNISYVIYLYHRCIHALPLRLGGSIPGHTELYTILLCVITLINARGYCKGLNY